ncbi:hypothetical protein BCR41DRAFT_110412 [Lobosporangium transversale]|uniref:Uncharacterized protein n=1 Tax=Lobosporangium transversale TaxID=64571 RepID=A0A1Y2GHR7_9FUNG|nr:hypothetical protein BCR41DRAFT_110412 [Lobosporangium transversale]ORZ11277.1 hypothetical protein BCR41DRAFT_110412 [Lobosporangium transversale]|eukprot:XP_021879592.1 hypothetical protein BCR41DRAFT_110412 [Lobosporangium transversale]
MELLQLRNHDPSVWTVDRLSEEFGMKREDIQALTKYVNTYTIIPGKDAKGRESGVWCEDLRGVQVLERASAMQKDTKNGGESASAAAASTSASSSSSPSSTTTTISTAMTRNREQAL